jgi:hypothetical protein
LGASGSHSGPGSSSSLRDECLSKLGALRAASQQPRQQQSAEQELAAAVASVTLHLHWLSLLAARLRGQQRDGLMTANQQQLLPQDDAAGAAPVGGSAGSLLASGAPLGALGPWRSDAGAEMQATPLAHRARLQAPLALGSGRVTGRRRGQRQTGCCALPQAGALGAQGGQLPPVPPELAAAWQACQAAIAFCERNSRLVRDRDAETEQAQAQWLALLRLHVAHLCTNEQQQQRRQHSGPAAAAAAALQQAGALGQAAGLVGGALLAGVARRVMQDVLGRLMDEVISCMADYVRLDAILLAIIQVGAGRRAGCLGWPLSRPCAKIRAPSPHAA